MATDKTGIPEGILSQGVDKSASPGELVQLLQSHRQHLAELPERASPVDRAHVELDIAEALLGLGHKDEAWDTARQAFTRSIEAEAWQEAVEACHILYRTELDDSIVALANGVWLAVTFPVFPHTTVALLQCIVEETPDESDGAAVAAAVAHYIADLRTEGKEQENLTFFTTQILAQVAKRHRGIEDQETIEIWMEMLQLNDPTEFLPRLATILDVMVGDDWWYDRDALRARLPVN